MTRVLSIVFLSALLVGVARGADVPRTISYQGVLSNTTTGPGVAPGVDFFIQYGSTSVKEHCEREGHMEVFEKARAKTDVPAGEEIDEDFSNSARSRLDDVLGL